MRRRVFVVREDEVATASLNIESGADTTQSDCGHSMCQPGLPGPNGDGQLGSPGRCARHSSASSSSDLPDRSGSPPRSAKAPAWWPGHTPTRSRIAVWHPPGSTRPDTARRRGRTRRRTRELLNEFDHLVDGFGGRHVVAGRDHSQRGHILAEQLRFAIAELAPVDSVAVGTFEQGSSTSVTFCT